MNAFIDILFTVKNLKQDYSILYFLDEKNTQKLSLWVSSFVGKVHGIVVFRMGKI